MSVVVTAGVSAAAVTSGAEVNLLTAGVAITVALALQPRVRCWSLVVSTSQDITLRVYKRAGVNAGLRILSSLTQTVTSAAPLVIEFDGEANIGIMVTGQASSTTAAVNCDFRAVGME